MDDRGLLFIPDISGFTRFINQTDIQHSRLIIQELLEVLINANDTGLEISEIEGDAILFYKYGELPALESIYGQVQKMFCAFHERLVLYDQHRFCQCNACSATIDLSLKIITHYGEFTGYTIKNFNKLIGKDVIVAHQLLKNDIEQHEYWMVTEQLSPGAAPVDFTKWMKWNSSVKETENGDVPYHYTQLAQLKDEIKPPALLELELPDKVKVISLTREYDTGLIRLFHAAGDFRYRGRWQNGVTTVAQDEGHVLPRVGMRYRQSTASGERVIFSSSYVFTPDKIRYSETDQDKKHATYFTLEKLNDNSTRLTMDCYQSRHAVNNLLFNLFQKSKVTAGLARSLDKLDAVWRDIDWPTKA